MEPSSPAVYEVVCPVAGNCCAAARAALQVFSLAWHSGTPPGAAPACPTQHSAAPTTTITSRRPIFLIAVPPCSLFRFDRSPESLHFSERCLRGGSLLSRPDG